MNPEFLLFRNSLAIIAETKPDLDYTPVRHEEGFVSFDEYACHYIHRESDAQAIVQLFLLKGDETITTNCERPSFVYTWTGSAWTRTEFDETVAFSSEGLAGECIDRLLQLAKENGFQI
jgi:hypothetical protein